MSQQPVQHNGMWWSRDPPGLIHYYDDQRRPGTMRLLPYVTVSKDGVLIDVLVQPRAARDAVEGVHGEALKLKVKAPPVDDRANRAVEKLLAGLLDLPRSSVEVVGGNTSRRKRIAISGASEKRVVDGLNRVLHPQARPGTT